MRAEKTDERMEDALADAVDLLTRRVVKYRKRLGTKLTAAAAEIPATEPEESMDIVREKHFALKPCSTEEAILQMDLLGAQLLPVSQHRERQDPGRLPPR